MRALALALCAAIGCASDSNPSPATADAAVATRPDADTDTWTGWAMSFAAAYCTDCHKAGGEGDPSPGGKDFTTYADVKTWAPTIRCGVATTTQSNCASTGVAAKQFPIAAPYPSDAERDRMVQWIDDGALQ